MARLSVCILAATIACSTGASAGASEFRGLVDVAARSAALQTRELAAIRKSCLAIKAERKWMDLKPVARLATTEGYGSDNSAEDFSWAVMVLAGRSLAGDKDSTKNLSRLMLKWAQADAFGTTEEVHDAYYALKRQLLPLAVAFQIVQPSLSEADEAALKAWIDPLVRRIDKLFDGDVDRNNHRTLADSVLAVWGSVIGDAELMQRGLAGFDKVLAETRADGTLELEARRGSRALWYQRQTLSSLYVLAEVARGAGQDLYGAATSSDRQLDTLVGALVNGVASPILATVYSSENHIPGPEKDFLSPDLTFLEKRGHDRHYMAWAEAASHGVESLSRERLEALFDREVKKERPLIDEFAGGNATCFWGQP